MTAANRDAKLAENDLQRLMDARHHDPFGILGRHDLGNEVVVRALLPHAREARIADVNAPMQRIEGTDIFEWQGNGEALPQHYRLQWKDDRDASHEAHDPYSFSTVLDDFDLHLFGEGRHWHIYRVLGAHASVIDDIPGARFAVWAPNAERVSIVGDFNNWDGRMHPMRSRGGAGVWELFIPELEANSFYKYEIRTHDGRVFTKSDPYGQQFELRPGTANRVPDRAQYDWGDKQWLDSRRTSDWLHAPMSIYEAHLGSWQLDEHGQFLGYRELAHRLVAHCQHTGFTHIELLPVTEHPLDASWGYQTIGYYAPTSRFGTPDDFRYFVDYCHQHGIGVLLDWAPGHFPKDAHGLARFDGTALYEHEDPRLGEHRDWGTLIFNYERNEVRNFLISSAMYWVEEFHIDGLRVDAVASMLYLDYSRETDDWVPNKFGGNENLGAIDFLRELNSTVQGQHPGTLIIAEESTAWPQVTRPSWLGGLGFAMKWNMGWMHDSLEYFKQDPVHRSYHHDSLTFGLLYAFTENFVLPFSHDEVVHGKRSLLYRMPGDEWQRFANLRLLYSFMFTYPGKKLLFMGCEFGQGDEWNHAQALDWYLLQFPHHNGVQSLIRDLNRIYREYPSLHRYDFEHQGFEWVDCHDSAQSVISYLRKGDEDFSLVILNFTPVPRHDYRIGVPEGGTYEEVLNSDSEHYGGSNTGNGQPLSAEPTPWMGRPWSVSLTLPPLGALVLRKKRG